jgi:hypothetical protein
MGYIAPIPHYQYKQYQEREIKVNKDPFSFFPIHSINPLKNNTHFQETETTDEVRFNQRTTPYHSQSKPSIPTTLLAQLTGKGKHFNEYV